MPKAKYWKKLNIHNFFIKLYSTSLLLEMDEKHVRTFCPLRLSRYGMFVRGIPDLYELEILWHTHYVHRKKETLPLAKFTVFDSEGQMPARGS